MRNISCLAPVESLQKKATAGRCLAWLAVGLLASAAASHGQTFGSVTSLHYFTGGDGGNSYAGLVLGPGGNFYGTTSGDNTSGYGTVFVISPAGALTTLYSFTGGADGGNPNGNLLLGSDGNFYGTTSGDNTATGYGTIFQMTPAGALTTLYSFTGGTDGGTPDAGLIEGPAGNFYGTTSGDNTTGYGTVFEITPAGVLTTLYTFTGGADGGDPEGNLVLGPNGNFYGTTSGDNTSGYGTIFEITPAGALTTLYSFTGGADGGNPQAGLVLGVNGNFYGTAGGENTSGYGTVFEATPAGALTTLYSFTGGIDGDAPDASLLLGSDGNFYGTTSGDISGNYGTVFQVTPAGVLSTLYGFSGLSDGGEPEGSLIQVADGSFYGTTYSTDGGSGYGTVFQLKLGPPPAFFDGEVALSDGVDYLAFPGGNFFGYYSFLANPAYLYHFDLGYEYVIDAADGKSGVYLYDFASSDFFYTSPSFPFPYLYDFNLGSVLYYYPDPNNAGRYNTNGVRYFYEFNTGTIITK